MRTGWDWHKPLWNSPEFCVFFYFFRPKIRCLLLARFLALSSSAKRCCSICPLSILVMNGIGNDGRNICSGGPGTYDIWIGSIRWVHMITVRQQFAQKGHGGPKYEINADIACVWSQSKAGNRRCTASFFDVCWWRSTSESGAAGWIMDEDEDDAAGSLRDRQTFVNEWMRDALSLCLFPSIPSLWLFSGQALCQIVLLERWVSPWICGIVNWIMTPLSCMSWNEFCVG